MITVPLKAKLVGFAFPAILIFALIGTALEQVKELQAASTAVNGGGKLDQVILTTPLRTGSLTRPSPRRSSVPFSTA